jgi:hypothetical protein
MSVRREMSMPQYGSIVAICAFINYFEGVAMFEMD